ncbi:MAG: GFA family protein, partial [Caulobacteraceae bacterium]|nr:GFA family protein [Caulobacteraceae bacterium]
MAEQTYEGSCHCGAVAYSAKLDLEAPVISCNCSHCRRKGFLLAFVQPDAFDLKKG